jgi:signal transduction histidine kinase/purine-cytosine permease-like protein
MTSATVPAKRSYQSWIANETLEDYSLRYAAKSFRRWKPFAITNTALGGISFLALEAIGGAITLSYGFSNAFPAILVVCLCIFVTSFPIAYYASKFNIDMDLLTRGAGFGYIGSTVTSLIYASFTFIFFALEAAIMAQALRIYLEIPLVIGYILSSLVIIPITFMGITMISRLQIITQPLWALMLVTPFVFVFIEEPQVLRDWFSFSHSVDGSSGFNYLAFGAATGVVFSLVVQIGEQVDYLRFLPDKTDENKLAWWSAVVVAGPGWILIGGLKILAGSLLAVLAVNAGLPYGDAVEPIHMYIRAYEYVSDDPSIVLAAATVFVLISQVKINVTNAYAGSLAWSNFYSRVTHYHPGRVVWLVFNILISLLLMLLGIFDTLEIVLAVYSNIAIAWIAAIFADLVVLKPLRISPSFIEFKRAYLYNVNPVGCGAMAVASVISVLCFGGAFGPVLEAYSAVVSFTIAFTLAIALGFLTKGKYYLARTPARVSPQAGGNETAGTVPCSICDYSYESNDMADCPFYEGPICSLCCSLDAHCHDTCKKPISDLLQKKSHYIGRSFTRRLAPNMVQRLAKFLGVSVSLGLVTAGLFLLAYRMIDLDADAEKLDNGVLLMRVYLSLLPLLCIGSWWIVLSHESRELAERDLVTSLEKLRDTQHELRQTERLAAIGQLTATVSHELRNPLGTLMTSVSVLTRYLDGTEPHVREEIDRIQRNVWRCVRIIEDLLEFSRKRDATLRPVALDAWIEQQVGETRPANSVSVRLDLASGATVPIDSEKLRQAFINILQNAFQAVEVNEARQSGSSQIVVRTRNIEQMVEISVEDNGPGMSPESLRRIFEPLFSTKAFGVGLGMTLVKRIAEQHGGRVAVDSQQGVGTKVTMLIPIGAPGEGSTKPPGEARQVVSSDSESGFV